MRYYHGLEESKAPGQPGATRNESAASIFTPKKSRPSDSSETPKRWRNQIANIVCTARPPANASMANRLESLKIMLRTFDFWLFCCVFCFEAREVPAMRRLSLPFGLCIAAAGDS